MEHLEGSQSVLAALEARHRRFEVILLGHGSNDANVDRVRQLAEELGVPVRWADRRELDALAHGATHGGVLAVCSPRPRTTPGQMIELLDRLSEPPLILLLEGIEDARNLGFTLRSAEALGAHAVFIKKHLWDWDPVEVARPSSGASERLPLVQVEDVAFLEQLRRRGLALLGCIAGARQTIHQARLTGPTILAIGGEKRGLSGAVRSICDGMVSIPSRPGAASLSLSHAAAVVLAEAMRQRLAGPPGRPDSKQ